MKNNKRKYKHVCNVLPAALRLQSHSGHLEQNFSSTAQAGTVVCESSRILFLVAYLPPFSFPSAFCFLDTFSLPDWFSRLYPQPWSKLVPLYPVTLSSLSDKRAVEEADVR